MIRHLALLGVFALLPVAANAGTIDFESGFGDGFFIGTVPTGDNSVSFRVGPGSPDNFAVVTGVGGFTTAFLPNDTPDGGAGGNFFLSDEARGPSIAHDYFLTFLNAVSTLSLDLYDFRGDGGAPVGSTATLEIFADVNRTMSLGTTTFTSIAGLPEGNVVNLAIGSMTGIRAAQLNIAGDVGTGIDNIRFQNVPEPTSLGSLLAGAAMLLGLVRRKR